MRQDMRYEEYRQGNSDTTYSEEQNWYSHVHLDAATHRDKIFEPSTKRRLSIVVIGISFIVWCLFAFMTFVAYGALETSLSPSAHASQIFLIVGLFLFTCFVLWANILRKRLRK